jgi:hypothetical protein
MSVSVPAKIRVCIVNFSNAIPVFTVSISRVCKFVRNQSLCLHTLGASACQQLQRGCKQAQFQSESGQLRGAWLRALPMSCSLRAAIRRQFGALCRLLFHSLRDTINEIKRAKPRVVRTSDGVGFSLLGTPWIKGSAVFTESGTN